MLTLALCSQSDWKKDDLNFRMEQQKHGLDIVGLGTQPYYNVDLDTMHSDLYKGYFCTPAEFLDDLTRIQINVEINALLEGNDTEGPQRAGMMMNHANVMVDQTFDAAFRAETAKLAVRIKEREETAPPGTAPRTRKNKSKDLPPAGFDLATVARIAAEAGGLHKLHPSPLQGDGAVVDESTAAAAANGDTDRTLKRVRLDDGTLGSVEENEQGPSKRPRSVNDLVNGSTASDVFGAPGVMAQQGPAFAPASGIHGSIVQMPVATVDLQPPYLSGLPQQQLLASQAPPMPVGAAPDSPAFGSPMFPSVDPSTSTGHMVSALNGPPTQAPSAAHASGSVSENQARPPVASRSLLDGDAVMTPPFSKNPSRAATPEPLPEFVIPRDRVVQLEQSLTSSTEDLTIDQLEQLRAACFDVLWRGRKAWDRTEMLDELDELISDFVEEATSS